jgi:hypothetical protein
MKIKALLFISLMTTLFCHAQLSKEYMINIQKSDSLYNIKEYKSAALCYSAAFKSNGWKATTNDRYNAACTWALANISDSAFYHLTKLVTKVNYSNYEHITTDTDLNSLHNDKRWNPLLELVKINKQKAEANYNKPLMAQLDTIFTEDQKYRVAIHDVEKKYGLGSPEVKKQWKFIESKDSINLVQVSKILDKYGWLGADAIGPKGNSTLFLVIQHADLKTQQKYLPIMREAVKNKKAYGADLALLEDRVAFRQGKRQIYGSQIGTDPTTQKYYVLPLEDPDNVDKRRAEVGLSPLADYVNHWQIIWNVEQYKKDLPKLEEIQKANKK